MYKRQPESSLQQNPAHGVRFRHIDDFITFEKEVWVQNGTKTQNYPVFYTATAPCFLIEARLRHEVNGGSEAKVDVEKLMKENDLEFVSAKSQSIHAVATPEDFSFMLAKGKDTKHMKLRVKFGDNKIHVTGNWKLYVFQGPMDLVGKFRLRNSEQVDLIVDSLKINDRSAPPSVIRQFEEKLNPLMDTSDFPFRPKLRTVKIEGQHLILSSD